MTSFLRLNGIVVPAAVRGQTTTTQETFGKMRRSVNATAVLPRRFRKNGWKFSTTPKTAAEALAWRELLAGAGHVLSFDGQNPYTSKGMAPVSNTAVTYTTSSPKFGTAMAQWASAASAAIVWAFFTSSSPWSLAWWLNQNAAGWHHYLQNSAGTKWIDGVLAPGGAMLGLTSVTTGIATFGSATASKLDDVVALPYLTPADWPAQMYAWGNAGNPFSPLPALTADGLLIEQNVAKTVLGGDTAQGQLIKAQSAANLHEFNFELFEQ